MWWKKSSFSRGMIIATIPIVSIIPAIATWNWSRQAKSNANYWISHTQEVIGESRQLMKVLVDAETGIRGYSITRKSDFLEPYTEAKESIPINLNKLIELTQDNLQQQQNLQQIEQQIETRLNLLDRVLNILRTQAQTDDSDRLAELLATGKAEMDSIRQSLDRFQKEEWTLLGVEPRYV